MNENRMKIEFELTPEAKAEIERLLREEEENDGREEAIRAEQN